MRREPRQQQKAPYQQQHQPGTPYPKPTHPHTNNNNTNNNNATTTTTMNSNIPLLTTNNFLSFSARVKKLPPDANTTAAVHTKLYQLPHKVCFSCAKCRRQQIQADSLAVDLTNHIILCTRCFTRIIRPRTYTPTRYVPFPSLLSWLNYKPAGVTEVTEDVMARPAEAVAPSGDRMSLGLLANGERATAVNRLPAIAMNIVASNNNNNQNTNNNNRVMTGGFLRNGVVVNNNNNNNNRGNRYNSFNNTTNNSEGTEAGGVGGSYNGGNEEEGAEHPCLRVWGVCQHGTACLFRRAPADLCLAYLMGLCPGPHNNNNNNNVNHSCGLLHQDVYDLPSTAAEDAPPSVRYGGELQDEKSAWGRWVARKRDSPNTAEWQLWHNGDVEKLFDAYVPVTAREEAEEETENNKDNNNEEEEEGKKKSTTSTTKIKLNLNDIRSALNGLKQ